MNGSHVCSCADFEIWINRPGGVRNEYPVQVVVSPDGYGEGVMALDVHNGEFQAKLVRVRSPEPDFLDRRANRLREWIDVQKWARVNEGS
jgi:hypothetical protein